MYSYYDHRDQGIVQRHASSHITSLKQLTPIVMIVIQTCNFSKTLLNVHLLIILMPNRI